MTEITYVVPGTMGRTRCVDGVLYRHQGGSLDPHGERVLGPCECLGRGHCGECGAALPASCEDCRAEDQTI